MATDVPHQTETNDPPAALPRAATGIPGLDVVLGGGVLRRQLYVIEGMAGTGKTTLALHFLLAGRATGERCLWITTAETPDELRTAAHAYGWSLEGVEVLALPMVDRMAHPDQRQTLFQPAHVELDETMQEILTALARVQPARVVLDSLSILRDMTDDPLAYRRQVLVLKQALGVLGCTALVTDELAEAPDPHVRTQAHGVVRLLREVTAFGNQQRQVEIVKMRGMAFHSGRHDLVLATGGLQVFPRLGPPADDVGVPSAVESTGVARLDSLLGGGLDRGTSTLLVGAAGTGKSSLAAHVVVAAAERGEPSAMFLFDESVRALITRSRGIGFDLERHMESGLVRVKSLDPAEVSPGEFIQGIRDAVEKDGARVLVIDSLNGYLNAMPEEHFVMIQLHELLAYLGQLGVVTLLINAQAGLIGHMSSTVDVSYLADTVILLRYYETRGEVRQAISVLKKRTGSHERTIRELRISSDGLHIGDPLRSFRGVLTGVPQEETGPEPASR